MNQKDINTETVAETENFMVWVAKEPDEETHHFELGGITVHFFDEEWEEFIELKDQFIAAGLEKNGDLAETKNFYAGCEQGEEGVFYTLEVNGATLYFGKEDWSEICELLKDL